MGELAPALATIDPEMLRNVARSRPRVAITAATPEVVELVGELGALARLILTHNQRVMTGEAVDWATLAELLAAALDECQRQVVVRLDDTDDTDDR